MKQAQFHWIIMGVLALGFPIAAFADLSQTVTLPANTALSLDTGATSGSGGDLLFDGGSITPQGAAIVHNVGLSTPAAFDALTLQIVESFGYLPVPITGVSLAVDNAFVVYTNGGNYSKVLITAVSSSSITLQFTTFVVFTGPSVPTIKAIQNNSSLIPEGFPNYGIAPSSLFVVIGSDLADPGAPVLQSSAAPGIPKTLNGASLLVTVNGVTTYPALYYTSPTRLAAVLPAATPVGTGTLVVTYNDVASASATIQVVPHALGIDNYDGSLAAATDAVTGAVFTFTNSAAPGQVMVLWATGLGADPADSDTTYTTTPHAVSAPLQIYIGGVQAAISYQGASVYPGVNQINVTIPQSVPTGCWIPVAAVIGSFVSNMVTVPINTGGGVCTDARAGVGGNQISSLGGQSAVKSGTLFVAQGTSPNATTGAPQTTDFALATFTQTTGASYAGGGSLSPGGCILQNVSTSVLRRGWARCGDHNPHWTIREPAHADLTAWRNGRLFRAAPGRNHSLVRGNVHAHGLRRNTSRRLLDRG